MVWNNLWLRGLEVSFADFSSTISSLTITDLADRPSKHVFSFTANRHANLNLQLLRSPIFHEMVGRVHQRVQHLRHGIPMEPSRTSLENKGMASSSMSGWAQSGSSWTGFPLKKFVEYFKEEIKDQAKGNPRNKL